MDILNIDLIKTFFVGFFLVAFFQQKNIIDAEELHMNFIGRDEEQKAINYLLREHDKYQGCVVYGRRRLGKTELLKHCLTDKGIPCIFFQCTQTNESTNVRELTALVAEALALKHLHFDSFSEAIDFLFEYSKTKEIYVVIDEYPYIRKIIDGLDSKIQKIIDKHQAIAKIKLFLSGSSIATMEALQSESSALYRRFQLSILIKEMDYLDSAKFYPSFSSEDKVVLYSAFGGVPYYNEQINPSLSVKENIIILLSGRFSHLLDEITVNMKEELTKINNANQVFSAIALGAFHYTDILQKAGLPNSSALYDTLETLTKMDLIECVSPINDKNNKKKSGYRISDSSIAFYYRYIFNKTSQRLILDDDTFYDLFIKEDFMSYLVPHKFEKIAKQFLTRMNKKEQLKPLLIDLGTYWYDDATNKKNGQFDIVGKTFDGYVFYEAKFTNKALSTASMNEEIKQVDDSGLNAVAYGFISKNGFEEKNDKYQLYDLNDLYMPNI